MIFVSGLVSITKVSHMQPEAIAGNLFITKLIYPSQMRASANKD